MLQLILEKFKNLLKKFFYKFDSKKNEAILILLGVLMHF